MKNKETIIEILILAVLIIGIGIMIIARNKSNITKKSSTLTLATVTNDNIGDYIDLGNDIVGTKETTDDWRILYVEGGTVYVILAEYLPNNTGYAENARLNTEETYGVYSNISKDSLIKGLQSTSNWDELTNGIKGAIAKGAPTIKVFINSYNRKNGTSLSYNDKLDKSTEDFDLYVPHTRVVDNCAGFWILPNGGMNDKVYSLGWQGSFDSALMDINISSSKGSNGIRPVVQLSSNTPVSISEKGWKILH